MITSAGMENKDFAATKKRGRPTLPHGEKKVDAKIMCKEKHLEYVRRMAAKAITDAEMGLLLE